MERVGKSTGLDWLERDIEVALAANPHFINGDKVWARQVRVGAGIVDMVVYRASDNTVLVVEIKRGTVDCDAIGQLSRYLRALDLAGYHESSRGGWFNKVGVLVGTDIAPDAACLLKTIGRGYEFWPVQLQNNGVVCFRAAVELQSLWSDEKMCQAVEVHDALASWVGADAERQAQEFQDWQEEYEARKAWEEAAFRAYAGVDLLPA